MKIDITSKQVTADVESTSASKLQQNNAKILFGKRAPKILKAFETYSKEKALNTQAIDAVLTVLKTKNTVDLEKFAKTNVGKKFASNALKLANAKSPAALFTAIKAFKFPKSLEKAASVMPAPTKTQRKARATKRSANRTPRKTARKSKATKSESIEISGIPMSKSFAMEMPVNVMDMLQTMITPTLARKILKEAEEGAGVSVKGLGYAKLKKLVDAMPANLKETGNLPDWIDDDDPKAVTAFGVGDSGEITGYYSPATKSAEFRVVVLKDGFRQSGVVSIWS